MLRSLSLLCLLAGPLHAAALPFEDGDCEAPELGPWTVYGSPVTVQKVATPHGGQRAVRVVTDNQQTMSGYEGVSHRIGELAVGDRIRVRLWLRPVGGQVVAIGLGRTSFEGFWRLTDTDWFEAVLDFRCTTAGVHNIWISQFQAASEFLIDDVTVERQARPNLGVAPPEARVAAESAAARVWFDRDTGAICGLENKAVGETVAEVGPRQPVFGVECLAADGRSAEPLGFDRAKLVQFSRDGAAVRAEYTVPEAGLSVVVDWRLAGDELIGRIRVVNRGERPVLAVNFPILQDIAPARDPAQLVLVDPYLCGRITRNAIKSAGCDTAFPGRGVMGWLDLSGERGGVSLASHDPSWTGTRITALPSSGKAFDLSLTPEIYLPKGAEWSSGEMVIGLHAGDWHVAADRYRAWLTSWQPAPDLPAWLRSCNGWVLLGCQNGIPFHALPRNYRQAEWMGVDYLHVQGEQLDGLYYDQDGKRRIGSFVLPLPNPLLGGPADAEEAVRAIHARGGHVMFYFLYERWAPSLSVDDFLGGGTRADLAGYRLPPPSFYPENGLIERVGGKLPEDNPTFVHRNMCLASEGWQDWMAYWGVDVYAGKFGADGMYWDVMGRNGPFRCFNAAHGHHGENHWTRGTTAVMERMLRDGRKLNPDYSSAIEGCSAALRPYVGFHLMSGATQQPEVFRYTLPDVLLVDGFSNHTWKWSHPEKARRVFLAGERFDLHGYHAQIKPIVQLRERLRAFTDWPARFMDTVGVTVSAPEVQARRSVLSDGETRVVTVTFLNEAGRTDATATVDVSELGAVTAVHRFRLDGAIESLPAGGGSRLTVPVAPDAISAVVLTGRLAPSRAATPTVRQVMAPGPDLVEVTLFQPAGDPRATVALAAAGATWQVVGDETPTPGVRRLRYRPEPALATWDDWRRVTATATWSGGIASAWCCAAPPLVNGDFETVDGRWLRHWAVEPDLAEKHSGRASLRLDNDGKAMGHVSALTPLKPNTRYRMTGWIKRHTTGSHVSIAMIEYEEGSKFQVSAELGARGKQDEWERFETEFTSHAAPRSSAIYLYNRSGQGSAWYDDLALVEMR